MIPVSIVKDEHKTRHENAGDVQSRWVSFELAGQQYAVAILKVFEVLANADIEPIPQSPNTVLGVINLRGSIVTVIDLRAWLGFETNAGNHCIIVINHENQALGIRVDRIVEVLNIPKSAINPVPKVSTENTVNRALGFVNHHGELLTLLEFSDLLMEQ